jgi:hypothetical protein
VDLPLVDPDEVMPRLDAGDTLPEAIHRLVRFGYRWRLTGFAAPYLPCPMLAMSADFSTRQIGQIADACGYRLLHVPDTMPLPAATELRADYERHIRETEPDHLTDWRKLVSAKNSGKRTLDQYARIFRLQHCLRLLMDRHRAAFHRREAHLADALAGYFRIEKDALRRCLEVISRRLTRHWRNIAQPQA